MGIERLNMRIAEVKKFMSDCECKMNNRRSCDLCCMNDGELNSYLFARKHIKEEIEKMKAIKVPVVSEGFVKGWNEALERLEKKLEA